MVVVLGEFSPRPGLAGVLRFEKQAVGADREHMARIEGEDIEKGVLQAFVLKTRSL